MYIYKNAYPFLYRLVLALIIINIILLFALYQRETDIIIAAASILIFSVVTLFFRVPERKPVKNENYVIAPADGTIIALEEIFEDEYLNAVCTKVSIFMSVFNVHQNIIPVSGKVIYLKHHPGKNLVAWYPKSSLKNEHTSVIIELSEGKQFKISQVAGIIARRIVCNLCEGDRVQQGDELGFIFFGSRVDVYLPLWAKIKIKSGDTVRVKIAEI